VLEISIGKTYQYKDNGRTLLTGDQLVIVKEDTRGTVGGGIIVESKAAGITSKVDRGQLHEYIPPPSFFKKALNQFILGFANKFGLLIAVAVGAFLRPYLSSLLSYLLDKVR
jgi:hypothetical protein